VGSYEPGQPIAAIDVGTNSVHLVIARPIDGHRFEVITKDKEMVRLGRGSGDMKSLAHDAIDRGVAALQRYRTIADSGNAWVRAVATSAVREAENRDDFLGRARDEAGVEIEVITGVEEARLIHLGVLQTVPVFNQRMLLIDIGGGSTELLVGEGSEVLAARSVKLGAIRLTDRFFRDEPIRGRHIRACRDYIRSYLIPVVREITSQGFDIAVGSSGTIVNIGEMAMHLRGNPERRPANLSFDRAEIDTVVTQILDARTAAERAGVPGLEPARADIIVGGAVLLQELMEELSIPAITVSDSALREGLLLDTVQRAEAKSLHHLGDIRYQGVLHLAGMVPDERGHSERVRDLALQLFDGLAPLHGYDDAARELLEAAALLANVGLMISHSRHHMHSYYVIRNSELLTGFTDHEVEIIAQVARYHRKSAPKAKHAEFTTLTEGDQLLIRTLAGILRVASGLDRSYSAVVRELRIDIARRTVTVHVETKGDASLEEYSAIQRRELLEETIGREVVFEVEPQG
jgi:exopolyphosphatase/guanosine-5'-triphosphate,3'-diphosphate pyrophosphatase